MQVTQSDSELNVLAATIYGEARSIDEPEEGRTAIVYVIINRAVLNQHYWGGNSIKGVCLAPYQFECWNGNSITIKERDVFETIKTNARRILREVQQAIRNRDGFPFPNDPTNGCDHYNNPRKENADWVRNVTRRLSIGNHVFYQSDVARNFRNQNINIDFERQY